MKRIKTIAVFILPLVISVCAVTVQAVEFTNVWNTITTYEAPVNSTYWLNYYVVSGSSGGMFTNPEGFWGDGAAKFGWNISETAGTYTYSYRWQTSETVNEPERIKHLIIELTNGLIISPPITLGNPGSSFDLSETGPFTNDQFTELPGDIYGIHFTASAGLTDVTVSFETTSEPIWGNFFAISGVDTSYGYNTGFSGTPTTGIFIPRPDGVPVPEPSIMIFLGISLMSLAGLKKWWKE